MVVGDVKRLKKKHEYFRSSCVKSGIIGKGVDFYSLKNTL